MDQNISGFLICDLMGIFEELGVLDVLELFLSVSDKNIIIVYYNIIYYINIILYYSVS
jgi:hypothetical protein